jgi:prenyl protein peptidase
MMRTVISGPIKRASIVGRHRLSNLRDGSNKSPSIFSHKGVRFITAGWSFFIAENLALSEHRDLIISNSSGGFYHACYNCLSTMACASVAYGYFKHGKGQGPLMYQAAAVGPKFGAATLSKLFLGIGLIGFSQFAPALRGLSNPLPNDTIGPSKPSSETGLARSLCPMDFEVERNFNANYEQNDDDFFGLERITRHPSLYSFAFCSLGWALRTPFLTHFCTFAGPFFAIVALSQHKDSRFRRGIGGVLEIEKDWPSSCNFPFMAAAFGSQKENVFTADFWQKEMKQNNAFAALVIACFI